MSSIAAPDALPAPVIDTHTHLNLHDRYLHGDTTPDADESLALAASVGVTKVVQIGCDVEYARQSVETARTRPDVAVGVSIHPNDAARLQAEKGAAALDAALAEIAVLAREDVVRAVGETGLDYFRTAEDLHAVQQRAFRWHIALAKELGKALVIHDRDAHDDVIAVLEDEEPPDTVVFHCFSGDAVMASVCAERGWFMSFAGPVTYKANDGLRAALAVAPSDLILVETDAPYLTPVPHRGKPNASYLMPHTVRFMAAQRGIDDTAMCHLLFDNAQRAFGGMVTADSDDAALLGGGDVRALVAELGLRPTKRWGQNFVTDPNTVRRIVRAARLTDADVVLEVGPGLGSLTLALLPHVRRVVAVEVDPLLAERLPRTVGERLPALADRLTVVEADALRIEEVPAEPTALVANLPYNVAVPVVLHLLSVVPSLQSVLVMVQKEVADRLVAGPGSRVYGVPSVKARWYCDVEAAGNVGTTVFWPVPHVDSGLVRMTRCAPPPSTSGREATFAVIDAAFSQRRKTLRSALASIAGGPAAAEAALRAAGVAPSERGESLTVAEFARISDAIAAPDGRAFAHEPA